MNNEDNIQDYLLFFILRFAFLSEYLGRELTVEEEYEYIDLLWIELSEENRNDFLSWYDIPLLTSYPDFIELKFVNLRRLRVNNICYRQQ